MGIGAPWRRPADSVPNSERHTGEHRRVMGRGAASVPARAGRRAGEWNVQRLHRSGDGGASLASADFPMEFQRGT